MKMYQALAAIMGAVVRLRASIDKTPGGPDDKEYARLMEMADTHCENITDFVKEHFPSGSGFDSGTQFDFDKSTGDKLVFRTAFHHMNEGGYYDGWTEHVVTVVPSLQFGFNLKVSGRNRNDIKDLIGEQFNYLLGCPTSSNLLTVDFT